MDNLTADSQVCKQDAILNKEIIFAIPISVTKRMTLANNDNKPTDTAKPDDTTGGGEADTGAQ